MVFGPLADSFYVLCHDMELLTSRTLGTPSMIGRADGQVRLAAISKDFSQIWKILRTTREQDPLGGRTKNHIKQRTGDQGFT